ncbi:MAG: hypothetical protein ACREPX_11455, partial [Rhodanobacteraceae bacterium]
MTRLREKGGASPDTLYTLDNGYVNASKVPTQRPGTTWDYAWPDGTKGLCSFKGVMHAFSAEIINTGREDYIVDTLRHPSAEFDGHIRTIHYSAPYLGYLYVVAEFDDDQVFHYWLRTPDTWAALTIHAEGDKVQPTVPNGYYYEAVQLENPPAWAPGVERAVGDVVQPTVKTGWKYTVTDASGAGSGGGGGGGTDPAPEDRLGLWNVTYVDGVLANVDVTDCRNVIGRNSKLSPPGDWPYVSGNTLSFQLPAGKHFAAAIVVPLDADTTQHNIKSVSYGGGAKLRGSISATPGDFDIGTALLVIEDIEANDVPSLRWRCDTGTMFIAGLTAGETYYLNLEAMDPTEGTVVK